jgi:type VI secretion system Hcp family effector
MRNTVLLLAITLSALSIRAQKVYMKVEGTRSGIIRDDNMLPRMADWIELTGYSFEAASPHDVNGQPSGRLTTGQLSITKNYGKSSVQLFKACAENESLKSIIIEIRFVGMGNEERVEERITFSNASITLFKQAYSVPTVQNSKERPPFDEIRVIYQKMMVEYPAANLQAATN